MNLGKRICVCVFEKRFHYEGQVGLKLSIYSPGWPWTHGSSVFFLFIYFMLASQVFVTNSVIYMHIRENNSSSRYSIPWWYVCVYNLITFYPSWFLSPFIFLPFHIPNRSPFILLSFWKSNKSCIWGESWLYFWVSFMFALENDVQFHSFPCKQYNCIPLHGWIHHQVYICA